MHRLITCLGTILCLLLSLIALSSCSEGEYHRQLLLAEEQVTQNADSCTRLLEGIAVEELNAEDEALYGLISSWLLYRQYSQEIPEEPLEQAFSYYHDSKDPLRRAQVYFLHSVIRKDQKRGQASEWMEDLYSACLAIGQTEDYLLASQIYQNYSSMLSEVQEFEEAKPWVDKFVDAALKSGHRGEYVQSLIFKANNCLYAEETRIMQQYGTKDGVEVARHSQFDEAFAVIYQALSIAQMHQMEVEKGRIYNQLALYHSRCQRPDSTLHYAQLSATLNEQLYAQGKRKQLPHYLTLADAYRKMGNADSAIYFARKTYDTPGMPLRNKRVAAQIIYNTYADLVGDYQTSMEWMRTYNQLNDSINQRTIASNIEAVQVAAVSEQEKSVLREEKKHTQNWLCWNVLMAVLIIASILYYLLRNRRRYRQHLREQEEEFNQKIAEMRARQEALARAEMPQPVADTSEPSDTLAHEPEDAVAEPSQTPTATEPKPDTKVILTGNTREQIEVEASSILFLTSESNYVKVLHIDANGKVQSKLIRQTMSNIEAQLSAYPGIIRCHRAFIVNLQHVRHVSSTPSGLQLLLDATTLPVPVSKTYISLVKNSLG